MIQDQEGYIWLYTDKGLCKFNGESFINFDVNKLYITNSEIVYSFRNEKNKEIWFYTIKDEFIKYKNQKFQVVPFNTKGVEYFFKYGLLWSKSNNNIRNEFTNSNYYLYYNNQKRRHETILCL